MDYLTNFWLENKKNNYSFFYDSINKKTKRFTVTEIVVKKKKVIDLPPKDSMYFIRHGAVKESVIDWTGNIKTFRILTNNDALLYSDLTKENSSLCFLQTLADTKIYQIHITELDMLENDNSNFLLHYHKLNAKIYFFKWVYASTNGEKRIYAALIEILMSLTARLIEIDTSQHFLLPAFITHEIISELSGVSRSYVTRIIERLKKQKRVDYVNKAIKILDLNYFFELLKQ